MEREYPAIPRDAATTDLLEYCDRLLAFNDEVVHRADEISAHYTTLDADSRRLVEHCRRLLSSMGRSTTGE